MNQIRQVGANKLESKCLTCLNKLEMGRVKKYFYQPVYMQNNATHIGLIHWTSTLTSQWFTNLHIHRDIHVATVQKIIQMCIFSTSIWTRSTQKFWVSVKVDSLSLKNMCWGRYEHAHIRSGWTVELPFCCRSLMYGPKPRFHLTLTWYFCCMLRVELSTDWSERKKNWPVVPVSV